MPTITTIPVKPPISGPQAPTLACRKVAAYARVSTDRGEQYSSYQAQVDYYTTYILMIQNGPPFALTDPYYIWMACLGAAIAWFFKFEGKWSHRFLVVADAIVLGIWSATGAAKALENHLGFIPALLLGCMTAVGGSMIRDISVGRTPAVFGGNRLYALPALAAAFTQASLVRFVDLNPVLAMLFSMCVGAGFCLLAYWRVWQLPVVGKQRSLTERIGVLRRR